MKKTKDHRVSSGHLRFLLRLEKPERITDDIGGSKRKYELVMTLWSDIVPASSVERSVAAQLQHQISHLIETRYPGEGVLDESQRLVHVKASGEKDYFAVKGWLDLNQRNRRFFIEAEQRDDFEDQAVGVEG